MPKSLLRDQVNSEFSSKKLGGNLSRNSGCYFRMVIGMLWWSLKLHPGRGSRDLFLASLSSKKALGSNSLRLVNRENVSIANETLSEGLD